MTSSNNKDRIAWADDGLAVFIYVTCAGCLRRKASTVLITPCLAVLWCDLLGEIITGCPRFTAKVNDTFELYVRSLSRFSRMTAFDKVLVPLNQSSI